MSYPMQEDLIRPCFDADKIRVCWNGVYLEKYDPSGLNREDIQDLRDGYGIRPEEKMILFVGRLTAVKGVINLVQAMPTVISRHPDAKLVILGRGELETTWKRRGKWGKEEEGEWKNISHGIKLRNARAGYMRM